MKVVILVPRREGVVERDRIWAWCRARWTALFPGVPIVEGHHNDGPFNRAAAINRAAAAAGDWDIAIVIDADIFIDPAQVRAAIDRAVETGRVTWAHRRWRGLSPEATEQLVDDYARLELDPRGEDMDLLVERTTPISWSCCVVIPRAVFDDLGGFDERFKGWGWEDMAFQSIVVGLYGHERIEGDVYHCWHPRSEERLRKGGMPSVEYVRNALLGRRYMYALRRDHGRTDRHTPSDAAELERDMANLRRDDEQFRAWGKRYGLEDWSRWWPTLEELRDGARAGATGPAPSVTLIVRSGGDDAAWPERSTYLRAALASLNEQVSGPIVQRVVYSDWAGHDEELAAIAADAGFYVAGAGHHGFTASTQRLWRYIRDRARGEYVFLAEDDFTYRRPVELEPMIETLVAEPHIRQVALLRDACYPRELEPGTILGWPIGSFAARDAGNGHGRLEHRNFWTMNPSLFRRSIADIPWPDGSSSERLFGDRLVRDPGAAFALWGDGTPWITHIGQTRAVPSGAGY